MMAGTGDTDRTLPWSTPVAGEVERVDFDLGFFARLHEADVLVGDHRLDLKTAIRRYDGHQDLRRCHHAAFGMHGQLLHRAVHRDGERLEAVFLGGLKQLFMQARGFLLGFGQVLEGSVLVFILCLPALPLVRRDKPSASARRPF